MPLRLAFWNCGVAPTRGTGKRTVVDVAPVIDEMLSSGVEVVALCEVNQEAVTAIRELLHTRHIGWLSLTQPEGGSRWDLALFYRSAYVACSKSTRVLGKENGATIRAGYKVKVVVEARGLDFDLYLLHWRSRLRSDGFTYRKDAAVCL